jgi:hypothetical protein
MMDRIEIKINLVSDNGKSISSSSDSAVIRVGSSAREEYEAEMHNQLDKIYLQAREFIDQ